MTFTEENYLKAILKCQRQEDWVSTNALAANIAIKASSVTDMLKKLKQKKWIIYKPYIGCKLSSEGHKLALQIIRKHRLWETFLCNKLGFNWNEVHDIAEELEHVGNPEFINRLDAYLGFPKFDPHGDAIPDANGKMEKANAIALSEKEIGKLCKVQAVLSHEKGLLEMLNYYKIELQSNIEVLHKFDFDDSVEVKINNVNQCILPYKLTQNIMVN
jgi:DtxR family transcriptional regulator, Mn-dependent transcriptional regulator